MKVMFNRLRLFSSLLRPPLLDASCQQTCTPFHSDVIFQFWNALSFCVKRLSKPQPALRFGPKKAEINLPTIVFYFYFCWIKALSRFVFMVSLFSNRIWRRRFVNAQPEKSMALGLLIAECVVLGRELRPEPPYIPYIVRVLFLLSNSSVERVRNASNRQNGMLYANNATQSCCLIRLHLGHDEWDAV